MKSKITSNLLQDFQIPTADKEAFIELYESFISESNQDINFQPIKIDQLKSIADLTSNINNKQKLLQKIAVVKLNGGLGTTMGLVGAKSVIVVRKNKSFLDLIVEQLVFVNKENKVKIPLLLMNSFYTNEQTNNVIKKYAKQLEIISFEQRKFPRLELESLLPLNINHYGINAYYPPGHGDVYASLYQQGILSSLISRGIEYLFISNADNLNATLDLRILNYIHNNKIDFLMEVTKKSKSDRKGGILSKTDGGEHSLVELSQFDGLTREDILNKTELAFNTNNIWLNIAKLINQFSNKKWHLPIIKNLKTIEGQKIIQLETAMGAAIKLFSHSELIVVDRERFLPVKSCDDLFLVQSNLFQENNGILQRTENDTSPLPFIRLGSFFNTISEYNARLPEIPDISSLTLLTIVGDVRFSINIKLSGNIIIIADKTIQLPRGVILENEVLNGNLISDSI